MNQDKDMESFIELCESKKPGCDGNLKNITIDELKDIVAEFLEVYPTSEEAQN